MIEITRRLARQVRNVVRRSLMVDTPRSNWPILRLRAGADGLHLQATHHGIAVHFDDPQPQPADDLAFSTEALAALEGTMDVKVTLTAVAAQKIIQARWYDGGVAKSASLDAVAPGADESPELPRRFTPMPAALLAVLAAAVRTTAKSAIKQALTRLLLRGQDGAVVATDGRQLLLHHGFPFPWKDAVLVPRLAVFDAPELIDHAKALAVGRTKQHVSLRIGPWTFVLPIDAHLRFPEFQSVIPEPQRVRSRLQLADADADLLLKTIPKLPPSADENQPITLDLAREPVLRVQENGDEITELELQQSHTSGRPVRFSTDRRLLHRAVQFGFRELQLVTGDTPIVCRDAQRIYLWMPLGEKDALPPQAGNPREVPAPNPPPPVERNEPMPTPDPNGRPEPAKNGHAHDVPPNGERSTERPSFEELINEAIALRNLLGDATQRSARLASALKHHRRQSRVVRTAIDSLRELRLGP